MQNKKVLILILLVLVAGASMVYGIFTPSKIRRQIKAESKKEALLRQGGSPLAGVPAPAPKQPGALQTGGVKQRPPRSQYLDWGRNPFLRQDILELKGILWDDQNPKAVINEDIVAVGDLVGGSLVVDIRKDRVVLYDGSSDFELHLKG